MGRTRPLPRLVASSLLATVLSLSACTDDWLEPVEPSDELGEDSDSMPGSSEAGGDELGEDDPPDDGVVPAPPNSGCPPSPCADPRDPDAPQAFVDGVIAENTRWTCDRIYHLERLFVRGATLSIEPGTTVLGYANSVLAVAPDAFLHAEGTACRPIVFTSAQSEPTRGDWGGVVLFGEAPINLPFGTGLAEGFALPQIYGGDDPAHACGHLKHLRIEYAGLTQDPGSEINALSFYGCGHQTRVDRVQTHMAFDDGMQFFGGGFTATRLVVTGAADDSIDIEQGFQGRLQWLVLHQDPEAGDAAIEVANQGVVFDAEPRTKPWICNATLLGSSSERPDAPNVLGRHLLLEQGAGLELRASVLQGSTGAALRLIDDSTAEGLGGLIRIEHNLLHANSPGPGGEPFESLTSLISSDALANWVLAPVRDNLEVDPGLGSPVFGEAPDRPSAAVRAKQMQMGACAFVEYRGAVPPTGYNWTREPWLRWAPR